MNHTMTPSLMPTSSSYSSAEVMEILIPIMVGGCMILGIGFLAIEIYKKYLPFPLLNNG